MPQPPFPHFAPELELRFQRDIYARIRPALRVVSMFLAGLVVMHTALFSRAPAPYDLAVGIPQVLFWLAVFGCTWVRGFQQVWQPALVAAGLVMAGAVLGQLAPLLADEVVRNQGVGQTPPTVPQQKFFFIIQFAVLTVSLATLRLQFRWAALLYGGVLAIGTWAFLTGLPRAEQPFLEARFAFLPVSFLLCTLLLVAFTQERLARRAFFASHLLEEERNDEKRRREQTEGKLQVLAQAIGGIVHDLGNPLNVVQMGAQSLKIFIEDEAIDRAALREFAGTIMDSVGMLNYLRLSLIEQTRVLEGKPIPLQLSRVPLRRIIEAGMRYQVPKFSAGREIAVIGDNREVSVDEMKLSVVFMNLIGNALKYSDGEVQVTWREVETGSGKLLLVAVKDCGAKGRGITQAQAARLFTAFGRLDTHSQVEGTGLGLLSVQKIIVAHGGEAFMEGYLDGTAASPRFSTTQHAYPTILERKYRTAFVVTFPQ